MWDYDQRFKDLLGILTFQIRDVQHNKWFIAGLLPHIWIPLTQPKISTQAEALEIAMHLESIGGFVEPSSGLVQVQNQQATLTNQLREMSKGKAVRYNVWCTLCRIEGHHRNECPVLGN